MTMQNPTEKPSGMLWIVATPIGNLQDITLRALECLRNADAIFAEDTRVIAKLLAHYEISKPLFRYDEHSHESASEKLLALLHEGKNIAFVSDAGTPGIADPGSRLVARVAEELPHARVIAAPGASAVTALLSISGVSANQFVFLGFPPHKKGRKTFFEDVARSSVWPVVFYESPHRIGKALQSLCETLGNERRLVIGRELTKAHEEIFRGSTQEAAARFGSEKGMESRGEFAILVTPQ